MAVNIHNLIAAINPDLFCKPIEEREGRRINLIQEVKRMVAERGCLAAAAIARVRESEFLDFDEIAPQNPFSFSALKHPIEKHTLIQDAFGENVAALYFGLLDNLERHYQDLSHIDKLVDNFISSPGSGQFWDFNTKTMQIQDQAIKLLEAAHRIIESIPPLVGELKEMRGQLARHTPWQSKGSDTQPARVPLIPEDELRKRFELKRIQLRNQVNMARAYARWAKPYLQATRQAEPRATPTAALVNAFNTALFELVLLVEAEYDVKEERGVLPQAWQRRKYRPYRPILIVEWRFRGVPERSPQGGNHFRGRSEITFTSYALNEDELRLLKSEIEKDDWGDLFERVAGVTEESLAQLQDEMNPFLDGDVANQSEAGPAPEPTSEDTNPFSALFSIFSGWTDTGVAELGGGPRIKPDSKVEQVVRNQALLKARRECRKIYEFYKKAHGMPTFSGAEVF